MYILLYLIFFSSFSFADLEDHFRKISEKSFSSPLKNIDFIYLINLDERPEKYAKCMEQLSFYHIMPYRVSAINGWKLSLEAINDVGVKYGPWMTSGKLGTCFLVEGEKGVEEVMHVVGRTYFCPKMYKGTIGCALSHLSVLQDAYDSGYATIWVMEDDIEVVQSPHLLSELVSKLDDLVGRDGWDVLFTDPDTKGQDGKYVRCISYAWMPNFTPLNPSKFAERVSVGLDFERVGARYGTYSMIVRRSGVKKILDFVKQHQIFLPYDMICTLPPGIRLFCLKKDYVSTFPRAASDNGAPTYKES